jgi:hydroxyacylglutathione hydrolase
MSGKMFLETVRSEGLAHMSYIFGHGGSAAVVDPRRDCEVYIDIAHRNGAAVTHIFETHRNEDYVIGSQELARLTGARILHGNALEFKYGEPVFEGDTFELGDIRATVIETPGHTYESISIALTDKSFGEAPVAVFTGDCLFIGDVGRTDFFPNRAAEVAGLLYDSIFDKLLPLGDHVILHPAHGAGSVCGSGMASREFSTLGYERRYNPVLQMTDRDRFVRHKVDEHHYQPPYFRRMEQYNLEGAPPLNGIPNPQPFDPDKFEKAMNDNMVVLDTRSPETIAGAFIPGSLAVPLDMIPAFAGWFLGYDQKIGLVVHKHEDVDTAVRYLLRLGYDQVSGFLEEGLHAWEVSGRRYDRIPAVQADELVRRIQSKESFTLLDVRKIEEYRQGRLPNSLHIYLGELPDRLGEIPADRPITTFCGSGRRAIIAASILKQNGFERVEDSLGSMAACSAIGCPIVSEDKER